MCTGAGLALVSLGECRAARARQAGTVVFHMAKEMYQARYKTAQEIRSHGAIDNLQDGPTIRTHGTATRLIAWPGNGYQTESVHVLTLQPGDESGRATAIRLLRKPCCACTGPGKCSSAASGLPLSLGTSRISPKACRTQPGTHRGNRSPSSSSARSHLLSSTFTRIKGSTIGTSACSMGRPSARLRSMPNGARYQR